MDPLFAPREMGNTPEQLLNSLNSNPQYPSSFRQAFGQREDGAEAGAEGSGEGDGIVLNEVYIAVAAFQTSLISLNSRYNCYAHGYHAALSDQEVEGLNIFRSFVARCSECHTPPLFTNQQIAVMVLGNHRGCRWISAPRRRSMRPH